jgi:exosortase family protein XrtF
MTLLREFKPALLFLAKFLGIYIAGNIAYGVFVESYHPSADPMTALVALQSAGCLQAVSYESSIEMNTLLPTVFLKKGPLIVLDVYEGCNGINVMIVFIAFIFAYGGPGKKMLWFIPTGLIVIHLFNLLRIMLLYYLAEDHISQFYFFHKYGFTAFIYLVVFGLWYAWVTLNQIRSQNAANA